MAVTAFADAGVEYAVLETGLGGRLDATNAVEAPVCSVHLDRMDHMALLAIHWKRSRRKKSEIFKNRAHRFSFFENGNGSDTRRS